MARLDNVDVAAVFTEMVDLLQIQGGDRHRMFAFRRAAKAIEELGEPVEVMLRRGTLAKVPGIGDGTVHRIKQILAQGVTEDLKDLRSRLPPGIRELLKVKGLGPSTIRNLYHTLGVGSVEDLELALQQGQLRRVPRMGDATIAKIARALEAYRRRRGRSPLHQAQRAGGVLVEAMRELPEVIRVELAGSVRRQKATVGDLDVLVATEEPGPVAARFVTLPQVEEVLLHGEGRASVRLRAGMQADLRLLPPPSFGAGLHYFTGSKLHNIAVRKRGNRLGVRVSDHGIFLRSNDHRVSAGATEEEIFAAVKLPWIPPELREDTGEVEAAEQGKLPRLVRAEDLRGDLHMHTRASDGAGSVLDMAFRGRELGYEYVAITDHSKYLAMANGLDEGRVLRQAQEIRALKTDGVTVKSGIEVDVLADGSLDLDEGVLASLDWVIASVHRHTDMPADQMTERVVKAMESGVVDCVGHPTGRRPAKRDPYAVDFERVLAVARRTGVALECNGGPNRMDLPDQLCRRAREAGVAVALNTDAHAPRHLGRMEFALAMGRRGWLEPRHVVNCQPWSWIEERRRDRKRSHGVQVPADLSQRAAADEDVAPTLDDVELQVHAWGVGSQDTELDPTLQVVEGPEIDALAEGLARAPLEPELLLRVQTFLAGGSASDPQLESALARHGPNALQVAFNLVARSSVDTVS